ncbi:MAG: glycosyltransferase family A protein [Anaerolineales bacterium]
MSDNNPRCSVVVRAFNEEKHIGRLLTGIMHQTIKEVEIVLVDSGSSDATVAIAARYPVKIVHIRPEEFTFGRSLNRGIEQTTSESVVIASAHVHALRERVFLKEALGILKYRLMQFWGTYRGFSLSKPLSASMKQMFYYPRGFRAADVKPRRDVEPIDYQSI